MTFIDPDDRYGDTPVAPEEADALLPGVEARTKADVDRQEGEGLMRVWIQWAEQLLEARTDLGDLTEAEVLPELHRAAFGTIWSWAGTFRRRTMNIGSPPERIASEVYEAMGTIRFWADATDMAPREVALRAHHHLVKIHPFVDGNGRITRLYADLTMLALTGGSVLDWTGAVTSTSDYVDALRAADATTDVGRLLAMIPERPLGVD